MNVGRIVKVTLAAGIAYNIIDYIAINFLLGGVFASMQSIMNPTPSMTANAIVNFGAGLILAIAYDKVGTTFGAGPMEGSSSASMPASWPTSRSGSRCTCGSRTSLTATPGS